MFFDGTAERTRLHTRIDELERRLALLEESRDSTPAESAPVREHDRRHSSEQRFGRRRTDQLVRTSSLDDAEAGREGARLVALEMLQAGYRSDEVSKYLRESFNVDEETAALAVAELGPSAI